MGGAKASAANGARLSGMRQTTRPGASRLAAGTEVGATGVLQYRLYHVAEGGRLRLGDALQALDDGQAIEKARLLRLSGSGAELWQEGRIVGRFSKSGGYAPAR